MQTIKYSWRMFIFSTWKCEFEMLNWDHAVLVRKLNPMAEDILKEVSKAQISGDHIFMHNDNFF